MSNVTFSTIGSGFTGQSKAGKNYIKLVFDLASLSRLSDEDLTRGKIFMFRDDTGNGQYEIVAPVSLATVYSHFKGKI